MPLLNRAVLLILFLSADEEYRRLHEALAEDGVYNSMGYVYSSDYYDPTQPTEDAALKKEKACTVLIGLIVCLCR